MTRWTIYDETKDDCDALDRIKREVLALNETDLTEEQVGRLFRIALELRTLRGRAETRKQRLEPKRPLKTAERQDVARQELEKQDEAELERLSQFL